jgi:DNA-binding winged helix-turn-helix (wHTH) protein/TolB-like protein/Tfp pilus assembly protein PilF
MAGQKAHFYEFGSFQLDTGERLLLCKGQPVPLPPKVYDTLLTLVENSGHIIEKEELMRAVWPDTFVEEANLTVNISALRKALGEGLQEQRYIETVPRRGYRFISTVTEVRDEGSEPLSKNPGALQKVLEEPYSIEARKEHTADDGMSFQSARGSIGSWRRLPLPWLIVGMSVLIVGLTLLVYTLWNKRPVPSFKVRSIAVLPFKPLVADNRDESLEMGMCDALITRLGGINQLVVRPTSSVILYNKPGQDPLAAGRALGVDALLDGYVQRSGDRIRVTVQLLSVSDGRHLWSRQFNEKFTDIFAMEDSISGQMVEALVLNLTGEEQRRVTKHYTENIEAYQLYLKGRYFQDKRTPEGLKKSIDYFQEATQIDPKYALAFAGLSDSYITLAVRTDYPPQEAYEKAKILVRSALEIDDTLAEAHASLANITFWYDWDWAGAESEFKRAIELSPNYPLAYQYFASYLIAMGRHQEALAASKRSLAIAPLSLPANVQMARTLFLTHAYDEAIEQCRKTLEMDQNFGGAHLFLGRSYSQKAMYKEALAELEKAKSLLGGNAEIVSLIGYTYAVSGQRVEALKILEELQRSAKTKFVSPYYLAMVYAGLGEKNEAFEWLERAYEDKEGRLTILKIVPEFDTLHTDSRFANLLQRVGLAL